MKSLGMEIITMGVLFNIASMIFSWMNTSPPIPNSINGLAMILFGTFLLIWYKKLESPRHPDQKTSEHDGKLYKVEK